ncbi:hypothetical protein CLIB1444_01S15896 [[Candida] jaroonii]|uniref:Uncharacterized protein n=1 Tax=[Candida] jaroonii TaxID=467808 RepID=A0ACA9Y1N6_9ASCO|nr:hypothetical protein CLIB1444_01S15896 [[Candida] jaroonii]
MFSHCQKARVRQMERLTNACSFCKQRKIKCDRNIPCSSCVKYKKDLCGSACDESSLRKENFIDLLQNLSTRIESLSKEVRKVKSIPRHNTPNHNEWVGGPENDTPENILRSHSPSLNNRPGESFDPETDEILSRYESDTVTRSQGNVATDRFDATSHSVEFEDDEDIETNFFDLFNPVDKDHQFYGPYTWNALYKIDGELGKVWSRLQNFEEFNLIYDSSLQKDIKLNIDLIQQSDENIASCGDLIKRIEINLPTFTKVSALVDCFFSKVCVFFPFVDEQDFRNEISRIVIKDFTGQTILRLTAKKQLYTVGLLLLILQVSYYSESQDFNDNQRGLDLTEFVVHIVNQFNVVTNNDLEFYQLILFLRNYQSQGPEFGESLDSNMSNFFGTLLSQKAYHLRLHRDPQYVYPGEEDGRIFNLRRKLWFFTLVNDFLPILSSGNTTNIAKFDADVKAPRLHNDMSNSNHKDYNVEKTVMLMLGSGERFKKIPVSIYTIGKTFKLNDLRRDVERHFDSLTEVNKAYKDILHSESSKYYYKNFKLKFFFQHAGMLIAAYYLIFQVYIRNNKVQSSSTILRLLVKIIYEQILPIVSQLFLSTKNSMNKFILIQSIQALMNKMVIVNFMILSKVEGELHDLIVKASEVFLNFFKYLSKRYFYSWRLLKVHKLFFSFITSNPPPKVYEAFSKDRVIIDTIKNALSDYDFTSFVGSLTDENDDTIWLQILSIKRVTNKIQ